MSAHTPHVTVTDGTARIDDTLQTLSVHDKTIAELVAEDYRRAGVFKKYGIDFCCGGGQPLAAVCEKRDLDIDEVKRSLADVDQEQGSSIRPSSWSLDFLADFIVNEHHSYVKESLPVMKEYTQKVSRVHGAANPEVAEIATLFDEIAAEMSQHMMKEERILFPYIRALVAARNAGVTADRPGFGTVRNPIAIMEHEHDHAGEIMRRIRELSGDYTPPEHACNTYRVSYAKLEEFEEDLHRHVHLENNILFPKAVALEQEMTVEISAV